MNILSIALCTTDSFLMGYYFNRKREKVNFYTLRLNSYEKLLL